MDGQGTGSPSGPAAFDTIAAPATAPGAAAVAIIRVSGPRALAIGEALCGRELAPREATFSRLRDGDGRVLDEALVIAMPGPGSFTGEDVVEFQVHGGPVAPARVLEAALRLGARAAHPGEFSYRAWLAGRLDLAQAEAILDVVEARTPQALDAALGTLGGRLSGEIAGLRQAVLDLAAQVAAEIDFPEDDVPHRDIAPDLAALRDRVRVILAGADAGIRLRQGATVVLAGTPNAGKSSLLNALLRRDRAIVTPIAGTTRDTLEAEVALDGIPVTLVDTAGVAAGTADPVEALGITRSREAIALADQVLLVLDTSRSLGPAEWDLVAQVPAGRTLGVLSKTDLAPAWETCTVPFPLVAVSAVTGAGLDRLERLLAQRLAGGSPDAGSALVANARQRDALERAAASLDLALEGARAGMPPEALGVDLADALDALGEITGQGVTEDVLETIFSRFCIGK